MQGRLAGIVERAESVDLEPRRAELADARRRLGQFLRADHHPGHGIGRELGDAAGAGEPAAAQDRHLVGERHHLAELVRDHQDGELAALDHVAQHAEHLVGLAGREHRGRLVEDEEAALEIELLEDLAFLPLAGRDRRHLGAERNAERHAVEKGLELAGLLAPVDHGGKLGTRQHEILGHGHGRHRGEVLVDHAEAERVRGARILDLPLAVVDQHVAVVRPVVAHDAFDQRALAGAVLAEQGVEAAGRHLQRHLVERGELAEALGHRDRLDRERPIRNERQPAVGDLPGDRDRHGSAPMKAAELDTAPNTPPCILIILTAWS